MSRRIFKSFDQNHGLTFWKILSLRRFYSRDSLLFPIYLPLSYKNRCFFSFFLFFGRGGGGAGGSCFVVRDLFRSGCRGNYYLTPPPSPLPNVRPFFVPTHNSLFNTQLFEISARLWHHSPRQWSYWRRHTNDQRSSLLFRQCCPPKWVHSAQNLFLSNTAQLAYFAAWLYN